MSLLGLDIGTTGCKAGVFSESGRCIAQVYREYPMVHSPEGYVELDSVLVWDRIVEVIREAVAASSGDPVTAISASSMGEAMVPVTRERKILGNSILGMDPRGAEYAERISADIGQDAFYRINPNILGSQYSLPKLMWIKDNHPGFFEKTDLFMLWGDLVCFMLGAPPASCNSLANRTLLLDVYRNDWSDKLLEWSGIPRGKLAPVCPGGTVLGCVSPDIARFLGLPKGVKLVSGGHDQCCNSLGCGCVGPGKAVCGIGTYECITPAYSMVEDDMKMLAGGLNMEHHLLPGLFVSFIYNQAGMIVRWFRDTFAAADRKLAGDGIYSMLDSEMPVDPAKLFVLPHFDPPVSPKAIPFSSGAIAGLRPFTTRGEILKAILECETMYFVESIDLLKSIGVATDEFIASGGGARSDAWLQIKADIFGIPFVRPRITEGSLLGAAMIAGIATGVFPVPEDAVSCFVQRDVVFEPDQARHARYIEKYGFYRRFFDALEPFLREISNQS